MGLTSRREKIVLFGDSLTQRAIEQGGWGESLVRRREFIFISFFFSFIITQSYVFSFFACLCWCFLFLNLIAARALNFVVKKKFKYKLTNIYYFSVVLCYKTRRTQTNTV